MYPLRNPTKALDRCVCVCAFAREPSVSADREPRSFCGEKNMADSWELVDGLATMCALVSKADVASPSSKSQAFKCGTPSLCQGQRFRNLKGRFHLLIVS